MQYFRLQLRESAERLCWQIMSIIEVWTPTMSFPLFFSSNTVAFSVFKISVRLSNNSTFLELVPDFSVNVSKETAYSDLKQLNKAEERRPICFKKQEQKRKKLIMNNPEDRVSALKGRFSKKGFCFSFRV